MEKTILKFLTASMILLILLIVLPVFAIAFASPAPAYAHTRIKDKYGNSPNWAGYAVDSPVGSVTDVKGSWVVPAIVGACPSTNQYSAFWVGIDGDTSNTVEQTGTDSDCQNGAPTYYAWFEFYPKPMFIINTITVNPGDKISAEVKYAQGRFTIYITDVTTGKSFSTSAKVNSAQRNSAEWIAEAPWSGGILPLADFGTANYGLDYTGVSNTNYATINGCTSYIGSFGSSCSVGTINSITMVSQSDNTQIKAQPSSLSANGTSFSVQWRSAGP